MNNLGNSKGSIEKETRTQITRLVTKLMDKQKRLASTTESHKVITKKYTAIKTEKATLLKELKNMSDIQSRIENLILQTAKEIRDKTEWVQDSTNEKNEDGQTIIPKTLNSGGPTIPVIVSEESSQNNENSIRDSTNEMNKNGNKITQNT